MAQPTHTDGNHGCGYPWCTNTDNASPAQLHEHTSERFYLPTTGASLTDYGTNAWGESLKTIGVGIRYNADEEPAPTLFVHLQGGRQNLDVDTALQLNEAVLLHQIIDGLIHAVLADSPLIQGDYLRNYIRER